MKPMVLLLLASLACRAGAEIVSLTDGTTLEGELQRTNDGWLITGADGKTVAVTADKVKSINIKKPGTGADTSDQKLASLRRAVANVSDPRLALERYKTFIAQNPGTPAAKAAEQDRAEWQDRLDKGLSKAGDQWVSKEQLVELQTKAQGAVDEVRPLIAAGKLREASASVDKALVTVPQSPELLYIKGILLYRQDQLVPARKAFESVDARFPEHAPTHNNLAVVLWKSRSQMPALLQYDKAMLIAPGNRAILDNVAEALNALPPEYRKNALTKKVVEHFKDQDEALQKRMADQGMYRWGSTWLNEKEYAKVQAAEKAIQDKIDALEKDFNTVQTRLLDIDRNILQEQSLMDALQQDANRFDTTGRVVQLPLPPRYYDLARDIQALKAEKQIKLKEALRIQKLGADQKKQLPVPKYTGTQKIIDMEGIPGTLHPTSRPATQPGGDFG